MRQKKAGEDQALNDGITLGGWKRELAAIKMACNVGSFGDEKFLLSELKRMLEAMPSDAAPLLEAKSLLPLQSENFQNAGATLSILESIRHEAGYMLSKSPDGPAMASIGIIGRKIELSSSGATEGLALMAIFCDLLIGEVPMAEASPLMC